MSRKSETAKAFPYIFPILVVMILINIYPFVNGIINGFYADQVFGVGRHFCGFDNFKELFQDHIFWLGLKNNIIWTISCVVVEVILGLLIAMLLNLPYIKFRNVHRTLVLLPWAIPPVVSALIWRYFFGTSGPINVILKGMGFSNPPSWLITPGYSLFACIVANIWVGLPFVTVMLLGGLQSLPGNIYEAADIDGAGTMKKFFYITLPMMRDLILTVAMLTSIWTFNMFDIVFTMTRGGPGNSSILLSLYAYQNAFGYFQQGYASAIGIISLIILMIPLAFYIKGRFNYEN